VPESSVLCETCVDADVVNTKVSATVQNWLLLRCRHCPSVCRLYSHRRG